MNVKVTAIGSLLSAFFASLCCTGPLILSALGVGAGATGVLAGMAGYVRALLPYRPVFISLAVGLLGMGFLLVYWPARRCTADSVCARTTMARLKAALWMSTGLVLLVILLPYLLAPAN